jgi:hypothetical protein
MSYVQYGFAKVPLFIWGVSSIHYFYTLFYVCKRFCMFSRKFVAFVALVAVLFVGFATTANPTKAATTLESIEVTCSSVTFTFTTDQVASYVHGYVSNISGFVAPYALTPIAGAGTNTVTINFPEQPGGTQLYITYHVEVPPYEYIVNGVYTCDAGFQGPAVPSGWTQRWMACSSAVFDAPGGNPVGNDAVWAGQSFYVNPTPKLDASGKSWSQVFVSSVISPWIPTSCVQ